MVFGYNSINFTVIFLRDNALGKHTRYKRHGGPVSDKALFVLSHFHPQQPLSVWHRPRTPVSSISGADCRGSETPGHSMGSGRCRWPCAGSHPGEHSSIACGRRLNRTAGALPAGSRGSASRTHGKMPAPPATQILRPGACGNALLRCSRAIQSWKRSFYIPAPAAGARLSYSFLP